tara:strand:+ start:41 stop:436 length:396 start_codon:yes stop_codon:yes gene_type:complete
MPLTRFQKIISGSGMFSRRKAYLLIRQGKFTLNGRQALIGEKADPQSDYVLVDGKMTMPAKIEVMEIINKNTLLKVILKEGRNRQIRRIENLLGHPVHDLKSIAISNIKSNDQQEGIWRELKANKWISLLD